MSSLTLLLSPKTESMSLTMISSTMMSTMVSSTTSAVSSTKSPVFLSYEPVSFTQFVTRTITTSRVSLPSSTTHRTPSTAASDGSVNTGTVVRAVVGGVLMLLLILTVVMVCVVVRYRRKHSSSYDNNMYLLQKEGKTVQL